MAFHFLRPVRPIPIEIFQGIRAVVGTVSAADASGVDLSDQTFFVFIGRSHRTDFDTGGILTMHTGSGDEPRSESRIFSFYDRQYGHPRNDPVFFLRFWG